MVLVGKEAPDLGQREPGRFLENVHRHLPSEDDGPALRARPEFGGLEAVMSADELQDVGGGRGVLFGAKDVPERLPGEIQRDRLALQRREGDDAVEITFQLADRGLDLFDCLVARQNTGNRKEARLRDGIDAACEARFSAKPSANARSRAWRAAPRSASCGWCAPGRPPRQPGARPEADLKALAGELVA